MLEPILEVGPKNSSAPCKYSTDSHIPAWLQSKELGFESSSFYSQVIYLYTVFTQGFSNKGARKL